MVDRIATFSAYDSSIDNLMQRQVTLNQTQEQLTSGKRVSVASDDPTAAAQAERALALEARTTAAERAVDASTTSMTATESALGNASSLLEQARQLVVGAGDASYSASQRHAIASQVSAIRNQLLGVANTPDGNGGYLFSGQGSGGAPFSDSTGGVTFNGTSGQVNGASSDALPLTLDGKNVWMQANTGNGVFQTKNINSSGAWIDSGTVTDPSQITGSTYGINFSVSGGQTTYSITKDGQPTSVVNAPYTSGQKISIDGQSFSISGTPANGDQFETDPSQKNLSVFDTLDNIVNALNSPNLSQAQISQAVQSGLSNIDQVSAQISSARSFAGSTLNRLDNVKGRNQDTVLSAQTTDSNATDLDMVKALSQFNNQQTAFSAALQSYATIQKMSLFNYLNG